MKQLTYVLLLLNFCVSYLESMELIERHRAILCAICHEYTELTDVVLPCFDQHRYHRMCLAEWTLQHPDCPQCRTQFNPREVFIPTKRERVFFYGAAFFRTMIFFTTYKNFSVCYDLIPQAITDKLTECYFEGQQRPIPNWLPYFNCVNPYAFAARYTLYTMRDKPLNEPHYTLGNLQELFFKNKARAQIAKIPIGLPYELHCAIENPLLTYDYSRWMPVDEQNQANAAQSSKLYLFPADILRVLGIGIGIFYLSPRITKFFDYTTSLLMGAISNLSKALKA